MHPWATVCYVSVWCCQCVRARLLVVRCRVCDGGNVKYRMGCDDVSCGRCLCFWQLVVVFVLVYWQVLDVVVKQVNVCHLVGSLAGSAVVVFRTCVTVHRARPYVPTSARLFVLSRCSTALGPWPSKSKGRVKLVHALTHWVGIVVCRVVSVSFCSRLCSADSAFVGRAVSARTRAVSGSTVVRPRAPRGIRTGDVFDTADGCHTVCIRVQGLLKLIRKQKRIPRSA